MDTLNFASLGNGSIMSASGEDTPLLRGYHSSSMDRLLQEQRRNADGTLAVLMIVFALFCFIWAPVMLRRCRGHNMSAHEANVHDLARFEAEARAVRATLQRMSMMGNSGSELAPRVDPHLEHRREFLDNALLTKKVIFQSELEGKEGNTIGEENDDESGESRSDEENPPKRKKGNVIVLVNTIKHKKDSTSPKSAKEVGNEDENSPKEDAKSTPEKNSPSADDKHQDSITESKSEDSQLEPCSICLTEYKDGDEICWSHNDKCNHFFHKACIQTWLLTHEECPCCRQDFLCLWGDEDDEEEEGGYRRPRHTYTAQPTSSLDWAEELAEEIQERILQRQRQLQEELHRREHVLSLQQQPLSGNSPRSTARNTVISVDDMAAGLLLYRHFPMQFASDPRRLALASLERANMEQNNSNTGGDVEVSHFGMSHGVPNWQTYQPEHHIVRLSPASRINAPRTSVFELVDRSSRQRRMEEQTSPRFSPLETSRRFFFSVSSSLNSPSSQSTTDASANNTVSPSNAAANNPESPSTPAVSNVEPRQAASNRTIEEEVHEDGVITVSA